MEMLNLVGLELESAIVGGALDVNEIDPMMMVLKILRMQKSILYSTINDFQICIHGT